MTENILIGPYFLIAHKQLGMTVGASVISWTIAHNVYTTRYKQQRTCQPPGILLITMRWLHLFVYIARTVPSQDHSSAVSGHQLSPTGLAMPVRSTKMNLALNDRARPPAAQHRFNFSWKRVFRIHIDYTISILITDSSTLSHRLEICIKAYSNSLLVFA